MDGISVDPRFKVPPLQAFDAFPKVQSSYRSRSSKGGLFTLFLGLVILVLVWYEVKSYIFGDPKYEFAVDSQLGHNLQLNADITVNMPCHYLTVDVRDAAGDRLHISDEFTKDGTFFDPIKERYSIFSDNKNSNIGAKSSSASRVLSASKKGKRKFGKTPRVVPNGPACRIYGSLEVKKVTGNLHITTLGHGYMSWEHTDHKLMNLSHVINEFSFGPFFPNIVQPLDDTMETTDSHFHIFQYFLAVVPTTYIDASRRILHTNQYSVTEMGRSTSHGQGVPGIFFKYDAEPLRLIVRERTTSLSQFIVRLAGIVGGVIVVTGYAWKVGNAAAGVVKKSLNGTPNTEGTNMPHTTHVSSASTAVPLMAGSSSNGIIGNRSQW